MEETKNMHETFEPEFSSIFEAVETSAKKFKDLDAIYDRYNSVYHTYGEMLDEIYNFSQGMQSLGIQKGDKVCLITENQGRWFIASQSILRLGAVSTLRGSNAPLDELDYIIPFSDAKAVIVRDIKTFENLKPTFAKVNLNFICVLFTDKEINKEGVNCPCYTFDEIKELGKNHEFQKPEIASTDAAMMLFTSGTTGVPKGVLISHKNILHQIEACAKDFYVKPGDRTLQVLPVWHAYEQIGQLYYFYKGCYLHFTTLAGLKNDLAAYNIDTMMSVPRIWEAVKSGIYQKLKQKSKLLYRIFDFAIKNSISYKTHKMYGERRITNKLTYNALSTMRHRVIRSFMKPLHVLCLKTLYKKLKAAAGLNFRCSISGGGALSMADELFYDAIGVDLRIGYGLTETSPVLTLRSTRMKNYLGSAGMPVAYTEVKIVDPSTGEELPRFTKGLVKVRGPQVMMGYYKDEAATRAAIDEEGWFNTGDLGWLTFENNLVLVGRLKETIVLSSGENVEPVPIEEACLMSPYIEQIVLVGQDRNGIGALIVPSKEALEKCGINMRDLKSHKDLSVEDEALSDLFKKEINKYIKNKPNLRAFEKIKQMAFLKEPFSTENGLMSASAKVKRNKVFEKYQEVIKKMYK